MTNILKLMAEEEPNLEITEKTRMPIGVAVGCIVAFIGGALWLNNSLHRIEQRLLNMEASMNDRWTGRDMRIWTLQMRLENPNLKIPEPTQK